MNFNSPATSNRVSQSRGQPPSKRPKLSIEKHISLSGSQPKDQTSAECTGKDLIEDLWGDDLDSTVLEKVELDETLALSQMPTLGLGQHKTIHVSNCSTSVPKFPSTQATQLTKGRGMGNNLLTKTGGVPLRRTASSGWPCANSFSPMKSVTLPVNNRNNFTNEANSVSSNENELKQLQVKYQNLQVENQNAIEKLYSKSGETNVLRDRLKSIEKEHYDKFRRLEKEFKEKINTYKQEAESTIAKLTKEQKSLQSLLDVGVMEKEIRTNKVPDSPINNRLKSNTSRASFSPARGSRSLAADGLLRGSCHVRADPHVLSLELLREIITPELLRPTQPETTIIELVRPVTNPSLFSDIVGSRQEQNLPGTSGSGNSSKSLYLTPRSSESVKKTFPAPSRALGEHCPSLEPCSLSLLSSRLLDISSDSAHQVILQAVNTCHRILVNQLLQLKSAVCPQNRHVEREREIMHSGYKYLMLSEDYNLLSSKELYNNERGISTRRALALLFILVEVSEFAASNILPSSESDKGHQKATDRGPEISSDSASMISFDSHMTLITVRDIVCEIEKQRRTLMFEGVLAGASALVRNLLDSSLTLSLQSQELIVEILRSVVCTRPGSLVLHIVLEALLAATKYPVITSKLCHNSDTCIVQVLCVVLQLVETPKKFILSDVFTSWVLTLFNSEKHIPKWLFSTPSLTLCQCRPLISRLTFTLLGEACLLYPSVSDSYKEKNLLEIVLTRGILLVCTLLYQDEHFGANVDPASVGYYELFLHSMSQLDVQLNKVCGEILETLCVQESLIKPASSCNELNDELDFLLTSAYQRDASKKSSSILERLDTIC